MKLTTPAITKETTMWKAWVEFSLSHSVGLIFFSTLFGTFITLYIDFLLTEVWLLVFAVLVSLVSLVSLVYLTFAKNYWFRITCLGISMSFLCFLTATLMIKI
jgi:hypothetical protein